MKRTVLLLSTVGSLLAAACAGELTQDEQDELFAARGSGGSGSPTTGTGGTGGGGPAVDQCVVNTTALKSCQQTGCHGGSPVSAGLDLSLASVTTNAKSFLDKANVGTMGVTMAGDPTGCPAGMYKLVDSANPMNSLLYTKVQVAGEMAQYPCGQKMPVIGTFTAADKACILSWINSVVALK